MGQSDRAKEQGAGVPGSGPPFTKASLPRRAVALLLDGAILVSAAVWIRRAHHNAGLYSGAANETLWFYPVAGLFVLLGYQVLFLAIMQSTPGMAFLRISLAGADGRAPTFGQVVIRVLVSVPSALAFGLGYIWALFHPQRQTWHDLAADTIVIRGSPRRAVPAAPLPRRRPGDTTYRVG